MIQNYLIALLSFFVLLLLAIILFFIRKLAKKEKNYKEVKKKHDEYYEVLCMARDDRTPLVETIREQREKIEKITGTIGSNIKSAGDFQKIFFSQDELLEHHFPLSFVFNKPAKIVSGDFYWVEQVDDKIYLILGDCTGYNIEASLMTILASALVKESIANNIKQNHHDAASSIKFIRNNFLNKTRSLKGYTENNRFLHGIELSICIIDKRYRTIQFAGAGHSIICIENNELKEYKGNKTPIGLYIKPEDEFTNHEIFYKENDFLYLYTDGYSYFGEKGKRFTRKYFKAFLQEIATLTIEEQQKAVEEKYNNQNLVDDFLLLGIKFN